LIKGQNATKDSPLLITEDEKADVAASFQHAAFSNLVEKIALAAKENQGASIVLGGGVSQNRYLRNLLEEKALCSVFWPPKGLCLDNAAMIAGLGYHTFHLKGSACM